MSKNVVDTILDHETGWLYTIQKQEGRLPLPFIVIREEDAVVYVKEIDGAYTTEDEAIKSIVGDDPCDETSRFEFYPCDEPGMPWKLEA
jgi:hypothetical protein